MREIKMTLIEQLQDLQMLMHREMHQHYGDMHNPHRGQGRVLAILKLKPEISQKELTFLLNMSKQGVAELTSKLEKNGYVTREQDPKDKRAVIIKLTKEGAESVEDIDDKTMGIGKILECMNDEEMATFSEYLGRIIKQYESQFPNEDFEERRRKMEDFMSSYGRGFRHRHHHHRDFENNERESNNRRIYNNRRSNSFEREEKCARTSVDDCPKNKKQSDDEDK